VGGGGGEGILNHRVGWVCGRPGDSDSLIFGIIFFPLPSLGVIFPSSEGSRVVGGGPVP
jgi:hypothetical protein